MVANKKDKPAGKAATEQPTDRESTANAPEAPALAESNQNASGIEDKSGDSQTLNQDKTPPEGGTAPERAKAETGDENGGVGEKEETGLVRMRFDASVPKDYTGPTTADVHLSEVNNWLAGGWVIDQAKQSEGEHAKTTDSTAAAAADASTAAVADGNAANGAASDSNETGG